MSPLTITIPFGKWIPIRLTTNHFFIVKDILRDGGLLLYPYKYFSNPFRLRIVMYGDRPVIALDFSDPYTVRSEVVSHDVNNMKDNIKKILTTNVDGDWVSRFSIINGYLNIQLVPPNGEFVPKYDIIILLGYDVDVMKSVDYRGKRYSVIFKTYNVSRTGRSKLPMIVAARRMKGGSE